MFPTVSSIGQKVLSRIDLNTFFNCETIKNSHLKFLVEQKIKNSINK